jgi:hypothetical protein
MRILSAGTRPFSPSVCLRRRAENIRYVTHDEAKTFADNLLEKIGDGNEKLKTALETKMDSNNVALEAKIDAKIVAQTVALEAKIVAQSVALEAKIDANNVALEAKIDAKIVAQTVALEAKIVAQSVALKVRAIHSVLLLTVYCRRKSKSQRKPFPNLSSDWSDRLAKLLVDLVDAWSATRQHG